MGIGSLGFSEMAVIFVIALIVFGPRKLPELGRSLGTAMREFRRSLNEIQRELEEANPVRDVRDELRRAGETRSILDPDRPPGPGIPSTGARGPTSSPRTTEPEAPEDREGPEAPATRPAPPDDAGGPDRRSG